MKIQDLTIRERPREKLLLQGPRKLTDAELLAIFLRTGVKGCSAIELAEQMLETLGGISQLFSADASAFTSIRGIGKAKYAQVQAVLELSKRYLASKIHHETTLTCSTQTQDYLALKLCGRPSEVFACLFLDNRHHVLKYEELFFGTIDHATVHPRVILQRVIQYNAAAVILAHNHPSGDPRPSDADIKLTSNITCALEYIDVRVLDHIIVGDGEVTSMADMDMLD